MTTGRVKPPNRFARAVSGTTRRLEGHTIALGLAVTAVGVVLAYIAWSSINGVPFQDRYELKAVVPRDSPILQEGDAVRIAGRLAGLVTEVEPGQRNMKVGMELRPSFAPVGRDARAKVRVKSLIYLTYVELDPGDLDDPMPEGGTIPLRHTGSNVDLLEVVQLFDRESRETLKKAIFNTGVGLAGRGEELNAALADLPHIARDGTAQLEAVTSERGAIAESLEGAGGVARGLGGERSDDVAATIGSGSAVLDTVAGRSEELGASIDLLRPVEDEFLLTAPLLDPVLEDAGELSRTLSPVLGELTAALPDLNRALALGDELRRETDRLTSFIDPVLEAATPVIAALEPTVASIDPLLEPLTEFVGEISPYADDITAAAQGVLSATGVRYPEGQTAPDNPALRFSTVLTCHRPRDPYPEPGTTTGHSQSC